MLAFSNMPVPQKILVALELSSDDDAAVLAQAAVYSRAFGAALDIIHVIPSEPAFVGYKVGPESVREDVACHLQELRQQVHEVATTLCAFGVRIDRSLTVQGSVAETRVHQAQLLEVDLLIAGVRPHAWVRHLFQSDVAKAIVNSAPCPVLLIPISPSLKRMS